MAKKRTWLEKKVSTPKNYGKKTTPKKVNVPKNNGKKTNSNKLKKDSKNDGKKTSKSDNKPKIVPQRIPKNEGKKKTTIEPQRIPKNYGKSETKKTISIAPQRVPKREVEYQKKKQNERPTYFSSGAMRDGFSPVNYAKSIIGTGEDILDDFFTGIGKIPESVIDNVANALAGAYSKSGQEDKYKQITDFVQRDLNKEFGFGDRISRFFIPMQTVSKTYDIANKILNGGNYENVSLLGEKSDSIVQSAGTLAGQIGLQESGINWMLTMASTSYNSALEEAYQNGATWEDSQRYAAISSVAEVLSERISGGIKLGGRTLDEGVKKVLTGKIKNNVARTFAKYGFDAVGEGAEEVVSQLGQNLGKKLSFEKDKDWEEIFLSEEARQEYIDSFIGGFILPTVTNAGRVKTSVTTGRDYDSNLSNNEINIVNSETQKRVNEAKKKKAVSDDITRRIDEANNLLGNVSEKRRSEIEKTVNKEYDEGKDYTETELSKEELNSIEDEVLKDLNLGKIDIDTIEEYFEPEKVRRINEINRTINNAENKEALLEERNRLRSEIAESMKERLREDYVLQESYRQKNLANEKFSTKVSKNESEITKKLRESMEASGADNTRDTHNLYSILNKYGNDTGTEVVVVNSEQMREIGFGGQNSEGKNLVVQGMHKVIDGKHKLIINKDSDQALKIIAGHEITHGLEEANAYKNLQEAVFAYAKKKGDYDTVRKEFESLYDGITDDIDGEVTAELVGRYLFEDDAFVNQLSAEKPGLIKQILEKVKRLLNMVTAGSKEARELERVKQRFEDAYRESSEAIEKKKDDEKQFSLTEDSNGKVLSEGQRKYFKDSKIVDSDGRLKVMYHGTARADRVGYIFDPERATSGPMAFFTDSEEIANNYARDKKDTYIAYDERYDSYFTQFRTMINGKDSPIGELWRTFSKAEKEELIEKAKHITFDEDWENIIYNPDEEYGLGNYDDYTLKTVQGNGINALIQSWLEDGNLYNEEPKFLDVLRLAGIENVTYLDPEYRDEKTYNVYMNVTNPVKTSEIDEKFADALEQWLDRVDLDGYGKETSYSDMWDKNNRDPYEWLEDLRRDIESNTTRVWTSIPDAITGFLKEQGYDGIVDEGGKNSGYTHQVVIPFSSEQIKDTANLNPTDNIDIRYSLRTLSDGTKYVESEKNKKSLNQVVVRDYAAELQSEYDTTYNPYNDIKELYDFMDSVDGKLSAEDLQEAESMASSIADDILLNMKASQTLTEEASDILKDLRDAKIALSDNQKSEVATAYDGYGRYIQSLFGSVRISKNGVPLDEQWGYWADAYPNLFDRGTPDSEQPIRLAEIIEQLRNSFEVADLPNKNDIELKILSDFYDYPGMRYDKSEATFADAESSVQRKFKGEEVIDEPLRTGDVIDEEIALTESMLQDNIEKGNLILSKALERRLRDLRRERKRSIPSRKEIHKAYVDEIANEFKANGMDFNKVLEDAKDKSTFSSVDNTPQRFIEKTLGYKEGQIFNKMTMSKLGKNEADGIRWLNSITGSNGLLSTLYDKYQIKPASKESAAAQKYAEGRYVNEYGDYVKYGDEELAREFKDKKTQERIIGLATDPLIREFYDNTFDRINESRARNGYELIPKRQNYYLHFIEDRSLYSRMGLPFNPNQIKEKDLPTDINGMTADNKPGQPYFASAQQRKGIRTTYDILGGIEKYANAAKDQIYHIDDIQRFRAVRNYLADMFGQEHGFDDLDTLEPKEQKERIEKILDEHLTNFAKFLNEEANIIAGKTPLIDRGLEGIVGRRALAFMKTLNSQVGSNMVGMNVGSSLTNMISVVQAVSKSSKADAIKSFTQMCLNTIVKTDDLMEQSDFWTRRQGSERFYKNPWQKAQDLGYTLMTITDNFATEFIIRTKYNEFKRKGYDNPLQKADEWAARLLSDRSLGQMPQLYNSKALGLITKFQLEVRNQLDSMWYDTINEAKETSNNTLVRTAKITSTVVQLAVLQHLFGKAFESVAGYNPAFDIVSVLMTAFGVGDDDDDKEPMDRIEEAFLELLEDLPYTSTLKGGRIPMASALPVNEFITGQNKYGQDKSRLETIKEAAPYWLMPTGYGQIKKTVKGMKMFDKDNPVPGQYNKSGKLQYPVDDNVMSRIQASIFGANANKNAREYYDGKHKPLTEKQLKEYQELNIPISDYWKYRKGLSEAGDKNDDKIKYINELNFPLEKKAVMMNNLYNKKEDAEKWYATKPAIYSVLGDEYAKAVRKLNTFKADKDEEGKSISGSKKEKVIDYLNKSDFDYAEKLIIFESEGYKLTDDEHLEVIDYLNNREDVSYEQMEDILKSLGYEVDEEGNVRW